MRKKMWEYKDFDEWKAENADVFKNHVAFYHKLSIGNDCIISFEQINDSEGAMKFVYVDGVITVQGDYGTASFNWHNPKNHILAYGTFNSFGYVLSKLESIQRKGIKQFDTDLFQIEFKEFIANLKEGGVYLQDDFDIDDMPYPESHCDVVAYMSDNYEKFGGDLEAEDYELGMYTTERPYLWWFGLQTALALLEKNRTFEE